MKSCANCKHGEHLYEQRYRCTKIPVYFENLQAPVFIDQDEAWLIGSPGFFCCYHEARTEQTT